VRLRFARAGADSVVWIFSPSIAYPAFDRYYPGADVVDWCATAVLNYGTTVRWSKWWSLSELLTPEYRALERLGHPIMLAETATTRQGGVARAWYEDARNSIEEGGFPAVRALVLFHNENDLTLGTRRVDFSAHDEATRDGVASLLRAFRATTTAPSFSR
jgi:beta-mannanase